KTKTKTKTKTRRINTLGIFLLRGSFFAEREGRDQSDGSFERKSRSRALQERLVGNLFPCSQATTSLTG
ncbi:MAG: hypothetical protein MK135_10875, partial [Polyangiaceae bacterium]|nr:hypothetical protein [Polyangiaceae bacterium]